MADNFPALDGTGISFNVASKQLTDNSQAVKHMVMDGSTSTTPISPATSGLQGALTETAPATDTASSGLNGRLQRITQRLTSLIALIPSALGAGGGLKVDGSGTALPVSAASLPLPTGALSQSDFDSKIGSLTETAPVTDTASSGLNGRLQRLNQHGQNLENLLAKPVTMVDQGDQELNNGSITSILGADNTRRYVIVQAALGNTINIRVGSASITTARGLTLQPGQALTLITTAAIYAYATAALQKVQVLSVSD
jgi:hypothetical protein